MSESRTLRSSKRRKVSNSKWTDSRTRDSSDRDIFDVPSDSDGGGRDDSNDNKKGSVEVNGNVNGEGNGAGEEDPFDVVLKDTPGKGRRGVKGKDKSKSKKVQEEVAEDEAGAQEETPTRRSSTRTRKQVQRLDNAESNTPTRPLPTRRALFTPASSKNKKDGVEESGKQSAVKPSATTSSTRKKARDKEVEKKPPVRSRRSTRKESIRDVSSGGEDEAPAAAEDAVPEVNGSLSPAQPVEDDGDDDILIAQQLQQDQALQEEEIPEPAEVLPDYAEEFKTLCESKHLERHVGSLSSIILEKLIGKRPVPLKGLQDEYTKVHQLIEHTVVSGEGNSMLLIGARGCGKTTLVETALSSIKKAHKDDFYVVRLNGFLHTDDRIALREIWRQLGREMNVDDSMVKINNYADTMASLLALLSHPEELYGRSENPDVIQTAKSVIIVLDEFDLFASHPRQTLLYNLFDIAQARKAPLAVLGVTTRVDVAENLEKRVKSRYSHRYVFLPRPRTFDAFSEVCMAGLALEEDEVGGDSTDELDVESNAALLESSKGMKVVDGWRKYLQGLWQDPNFQPHLQEIYYTTKSPKDFYTSALLPITTIHHSTYLQHKLQIPTPNTFITHSLSCPDPAPLPFPPTSTSTSSASTTSLPLSLLLSATRLTALHDPGLNSTSTSKPTSLNLSFSIAYTEYVRLLTSAKASASASGVTATAGRVWGRDVAREAWGKLVKWGILVPVGSGANGVEDGGGGVGGGGGMEDGKMYRAEVSFEEVVELVGVGGSLGKWWRDG